MNKNSKFNVWFLLEGSDDEPHFPRATEIFYKICGADREFFDKVSNKLEEAFLAGQKSVFTDKATHVKRGTKYLTVEGRMQSEEWRRPTGPNHDPWKNFGSVDNQEIVIYIDEAGTWWARPKDEFHDGRFIINEP